MRRAEEALTVAALRSAVDEEPACQKYHALDELVQGRSPPKQQPGRILCMGFETARSVHAARTAARSPYARVLGPTIPPPEWVIWSEPVALPKALHVRHRRYAEERGRVSHTKGPWETHGLIDWPPRVGGGFLFDMCCRG